MASDQWVNFFVRKNISVNVIAINVLLFAQLTRFHWLKMSAFDVKNLLLFFGFFFKFLHILILVEFFILQCLLRSENFLQ